MVEQLPEKQLDVSSILTFANTMAGEIGYIYSAFYFGGVLILWSLEINHEITQNHTNLLISFVSFCVISWLSIFSTTELGQYFYF